MPFVEDIKLSPIRFPVLGVSFFVNPKVIGKLVTIIYLGDILICRKVTKTIH